jgi:hypothetical protein
MIDDLVKPTLELGAGIHRRHPVLRPRIRLVDIKQRLRRSNHRRVILAIKRTTQSRHRLLTIRQLPRNLVWSRE